MSNVSVLSALIMPILILLGIGAVVALIWLIWTATRPQKDQGAHDAAAQPGPSKDVLSIRRRNQEAWEIRIHGKPTTSLESVPDPATRAEALAALRALAAFAGYQRPAAGGSSAATTPPTRTTAPPRNPQPTDAERERMLLASMTSAPQDRRGMQDTSLLTIDLAHEIGEILDEMMAHRPELQGHAVTLQNRPGRGIAFVVDGTIYDEMEEIPVPEIRTLIREATKEWERR